MTSRKRDTHVRKTFFNFYPRRSRGLRGAWEISQIQSTTPAAGETPVSEYGFYCVIYVRGGCDVSWGVRGDFLSHPAQKEQLITAHIIDIRPRKTKLLPKPGLSSPPCKQRRRSASRLRSRAVKLHGFRTSAWCRHEDLEKLNFQTSEPRISRPIGLFCFQIRRWPTITYSSLGTLHYLQETLQQENGVHAYPAHTGHSADNRRSSSRHLKTRKFNKAPGL